MQKKLREKRQERKITTSEMADFLGYKSGSTYAKKERGEIAITLDEARKICTILGCSINDIFFTI